MTPAEDRLSRGLIALLEAYKRWLSPWLPRACRFAPTCSEYARIAVAKEGWSRGSLKAVRRLASCHPWSHGGVDLP